METEASNRTATPRRQILLDPVSLRVLGALMEKEMTTPDAYPLSLNALLGACNQRSSRDPVMDLTEEQVRTALYTLEVASLAVPARGEGRVVRFEHRIRTVLNLRRDETAVLCLLLLRGPQTPGELRARADRLFAFDDLSQVQSTLDRMGNRHEPLTAAIERLPGTREVRYTQLLGEAVPDSERSPNAARHPPTSLSSAQAEELRAAIRSLEQRVFQLECQIADKALN